MVDGTHPLGERADRCVVGDVDGLCGDAEPGVCVGESGLIPACDDDPRTFVVREQRYGTGDAAARPTTTTVLSCNALPIGIALHASTTNWDVRPRIACVCRRVNAKTRNSQEWASYPTIRRAAGNLAPWLGLRSFDDFERWIDLNMRYLRQIGYEGTPTYHASGRATGKVRCRDPRDARGRLTGSGSSCSNKRFRA